MRFGLTEGIIENIQRVFETNSKVDKAILFGSRAKGTYKEGSDIDIAIKGYALCFNDILDLSAKLESLNLAYKIDLLNYAAINEPALTDHIDRVGLKFYSRWKEYKLKDVAEVQTGPFGSQLHMSDYKTTGTPIITVEHLGENKIIYNNLPLVGINDKQRLIKYTLKEGDIVFSRVGSVDRRAYVNKEEDGWMFSGRCLRVRANQKIVNPKYLSFYFGQESFKETIRSIAVGATMPSINTTILNEISITIPDLSEQLVVTNTLSSLDNKIDLLHRQNKTLEQMAETLFRQWFIEEAEGDWENGLLTDEFNFEMGQSPLGTSLNESNEGVIFYQGRTDFGFRFPNPRIYTTKPTRFAKKFDTLVSVRAPVGDMNMAIEDCCLRRGVAAFCYKVDKGFYTYTYYKMRSLMAQIKLFEDSGTVFGSIGKDDFKKLKNVIPPNELIKKFQIKAKPLDDKIFSNTNQVSSLTKMRDALLPKFMSGEVRITI